MNWNLVGNIYGMSSLKSAHFVMIHYQTWPPQAIFVSDWPIFLNYFPLKTLGQMNCNLVGSIYGMSSMHVAHFVPIGKQTWLSPKLGRNHLWRLLISSRSFSKHGENQNLVGSIYGMSSMKIAHFVLIG